MGGCGVSVGVAERVGGIGEIVWVGVGVSVGGTGAGVSVGSGAGVPVGLGVSVAVGVGADDGEATLPAAWADAGSVGIGTGVGDGWQLAMRRTASASPCHRRNQARVRIWGGRSVLATWVMGRNGIAGGCRLLLHVAQQMRQS
jgi:hypothetical protein